MAKVIGCLGLTIFVLLTVAGFVTSGIQEYYVSAEIDRQLDRAVVSSTAPKMAENLDIVLRNMEARGMTSGHAAIIWKTPLTDTGLDYEAIKDIRNRADKISPLSETSVEYQTAMKDMRDTIQTIDVDAWYWYRIRNPIYWVSWVSVGFTVIFGFASMAAFN